MRQRNRISFGRIKDFIAKILEPKNCCDIISSSHCFLGHRFWCSLHGFQGGKSYQTVTSFGGLIFLIICVGYICAVILIEAGPVNHIFMAHIRGRILSPVTWLWVVESFGVALGLSILAISLPMRIGEKRLSRLQI